MTRHFVRRVTEMCVDVAPNDTIRVEHSLSTGIEQQGCMATIVGILGSVTPPGRSLKALEFAMRAALQHEPTLEARTFNLADFKISFADGRPPEEFGDDTAEIVDEIALAGPSSSRARSTAVRSQGCSITCSITSPSRRCAASPAGSSRSAPLIITTSA